MVIWSLNLVMKNIIMQNIFSITILILKHYKTYKINEYIITVGNHVGKHMNKKTGYFKSFITSDPITYKGQ